MVCGTDADLAAVVLRLLRTERLSAVPVGYVPSSASSSTAENFREASDADISRMDSD